MKASSLAYPALSLAHVIGELIVTPAGRRARTITKPLLMPTLLFTHRPASPAVNTALVASTIGDVALLFEGPVAVLTGIAGFATAHLAYLTRLWSVGRPAGRGTTLLISGATVVVAGVAAVALRRTLTGDDRRLLAPASGYAALVSAMGAAAVRAGIARRGPQGRELIMGGVLFVISDALVAARLFGPKDRLPPGPLDAVIMSTYCAAQACLVDGLEGMS